MSPTPRERFLAALDRRPLPGLVPHFELVFFLTMETFGKIHPNHRNYHQWIQMTENERRLHREEIAELHIQTAERFEHSAIVLHPKPGTVEETIRLIDLIRERSGDRYALLANGDATFGIPNGSDMMEFSRRLYEEPDEITALAQRRVDQRLKDFEKLDAHGDFDGVVMCSDYCFNEGPFLRPEMFETFVYPYLKRLIAEYRSAGYYTIKHTDGAIQKILNYLLDANPHALHSLDPQAGVDIAEMVRVAGDRVCLAGNVDCAKMDTGSDEEVLESARYALREGMQAPGYIFCTSNCIYTGMRLSRYEMILDLWRKEGVRKEPTPARSAVLA